METNTIYLSEALLRGNSRVFKIDDGDSESAIEVTLEGITITGGTVSIGTEFYDRGRILNRESLTVTNSTISGNSESAIANNGNGILNNSTISGNITKVGAGIFNSGIVTVTNSTLSGNSAVNGGGVIFNNDGDLSEAIPFDQRGAGFDRLLNGTVDIGAVEALNIVNPTEHFYTINEAEREFILENIPDFQDEGMGFFANPI